MHKYAEHIVEVAIELWGDINKKMSHGNEVRFGSYGSKSVDKEKGVWTDHETNESGGFVDLCKIAYPEANGHLADFLEKRFGMDKDPSFTKKTGNTITTYDYIGDHGVLVYQVVRTDFEDGKKTFRQQRPDGQGGWISSIKGIERIPYNLPEILHRKDQWVWVVEGEKCVERLRDIGIVATTNNGGSGNWGLMDSITNLALSYLLLNWGKVQRELLLNKHPRSAVHYELMLKDVEACRMLLMNLKCVAD